MFPLHISVCLKDVLEQHTGTLEWNKTCLFHSRHVFYCFHPEDLSRIYWVGNEEEDLSAFQGLQKVPMNILLKHILFFSSLATLTPLISRTMGCIQSIACKPRIRRENIVVYEVSASIDQCPTIIEENSPIVLRYKTPYFRASAGIVMPPVPRNETWTVGWIQACTQMEFFNTYGDIGMWVINNPNNDKLLKCQYVLLVVLLSLWSSVVDK